MLAYENEHWVILLQKVRFPSSVHTVTLLTVASSTHLPSFVIYYSFFTALRPIFRDSVYQPNSKLISSSDLCHINGDSPRQQIKKGSLEE